MKLFDLHCDTIERMEELGEDMLTDKTQLSLKYLPQMEKWCQTFAIFIPDSKRGADAVSYYEQVLAYFHKMLQKHADIVEMANTADDIRRITGCHKCAALLSVEGGAVLDGKLENIEKLKKDGVKMMTLTWNGANELASGNVNPEMGFTAFGREAVKEMERQNIIVDVSHLNDKGMEELMGFATKPIIATHSNLRSVCSHKRNVTEEMFKYIVEHKGLCGLNLLHGFVSDEPMKDSKAELFRHVYRMLELGGEDVIACGSDFDGGITSQMDNPALFASFGDYMVDHGISRRVSDKIMFENALHFFEENIK